MSGKVKVWGNMVTVEWADPMEDPDPEVMAKVGVWVGPSRPVSGEQELTRSCRPRRSKCCL